MSQLALPLPIGAHAGPLFIPRIIRPLARPPGKAGVIHRAQTVRATPPWAKNCPKVREMYRQAALKTKQTGVLHVVDHIVPKCGATVCGLHVWWNLRVIHWYENAVKGAGSWPGMPFEQMELL